MIMSTYTYFIIFIRFHLSILFQNCGLLYEYQ